MQWVLPYREYIYRACLFLCTLVMCSHPCLVWGGHFCPAQWSEEVAWGSCVVCRQDSCLCRQPKVQLCGLKGQQEPDAQQWWSVISCCVPRQCQLSAEPVPLLAVLWTRGLCCAAPGGRMVIRGAGGVDTAGSWKHSCQTLSQVCIYLLITTQSESIYLDLQSRLWPAKLPMSVLGHSGLCPKI